MRNTNINLLIRQFSSITFSIPPSLLSTQFANTFSLCSSFNVRVQILKPLKRTVKTAVAFAVRLCIISVEHKICCCVVPLKKVTSRYVRRIRCQRNVLLPQYDVIRIELDYDTNWNSGFRRLGPIFWTAVLFLTLLSEQSVLWTMSVSCGLKGSCVVFDFGVSEKCFVERNRVV